MQTHIIAGDIVTVELCSKGYQLRMDWDAEVHTAAKRRAEADNQLKTHNMAPRAAHEYFVHKKYCDICRTVTHG